MSKHRDYKNDGGQKATQYADMILDRVNDKWRLTKPELYAVKLYTDHTDFAAQLRLYWTQKGITITFEGSPYLFCIT